MASDGEQALSMAKQCAPDLVITDVQMPHMSGVEFSLALREVESCRDVPILMLTARNYIVQDQDLVRARIAHVMTKPFSIRKVVDLAASLLPEGATVAFVDPKAGEEPRARGVAA